MDEQNFPPNKNVGHDINVKLNLNNYATKDDLNGLEEKLLDYLDKKVGAIKDFSKSNMTERIRATFFNSFSHYITSLKSINDKELSDYIKNIALNNTK